MNLGFRIDYYSVSLLIGSFTALLSGFVVYTHNRKKLENIAWLFSNLASAIWSFGYFYMITSTTKEHAVWGNIILHIASIYIPIFYLLSVASLTGTYNKYKKIILAFGIIGSIFVLFVPSPLFVRDVIPKAHFNFVCDAGPLYIYYTIYFFVVVLYALSILLKKYRAETNKSNKNRFISMILFTIFGFGGGGSVFFLTFNIPILPYPIIFFSLYPIVSGYAVFRYQLFSVKLVQAELLVFILWIFLLVRTVAQGTREITINIITFLLSIILGIFLIRSIMKEVRLREHNEKLAADLERANEKLKELDQMKSEFLSLATHQIRAPLTAIKGYSSMLIEGDFGILPQKAVDASRTIMKSCQNLINIVGDFLNISRIEQGRMVYEKSVFDLVELAKESANELRPNVQNAGLSLDIVTPDNNPIKVNADRSKIKQVIGNVIDNAVKYTIAGSIKVSAVSEKGEAKVMVKDTGIGIDPKEVNKLFGKFSRTKDANKTNVTGTGLGLYIAKKMVEAHGGDIKVFSEGVGKGTTFTIELPSFQNP